MARTAWYWSTILVLIAAVAVGACPQACAGEQEDVTYRVVDTGQSTCYGDSSIITCPRKGASFYGQDAQHAGNPPQYVDNGDGTVSDLTTGLMWQQDPGDKVTYDAAVAGGSTCSLGGSDDWRLPTIKELYSLINFDGTDPSGYTGSDTSGLAPFVDTDYFAFSYGDPSSGERIIDAQYWSSTEYVDTTMGGATTVFGVNFADGRIKGYPRDLGPRGSAMEQFVRYVRGNEDYGINDFVDNEDGTITDNATGLMWAQADSGVGMSWEEALDWAATKSAHGYLGYTDWRLPNAKELQSIVDYARSPATTSSAAIDPLFSVTRITSEAGEADYPYFWSSTTHANWSMQPGAYAAYVAFGRAMGYWNTAWQDVHGAGAQRSDPKTGSADDWPTGHGPQGDAIRVQNYVRLVRDAEASAFEPPTPTATGTASVTPNATASVTVTTVAPDRRRSAHLPLILRHLYGRHPRRQR